MGAMENKGSTSSTQIRARLAADRDRHRLRRIEASSRTSIFHNWTGDRITCRDWFQCLKEGLTVFRDQEFTSDQRSRRQAHRRRAALRAQQFVEDAGPLAHPVRLPPIARSSNFYTATVYEKGAEVVRMLKTLLGPGGFRAGMDLYFKRHDGQATTVDQFIKCFADASTTDLSQFMLWYSQAGTPEVVANASYDAQAHAFTLEVAQTIPPTPGQPAKAPMTIPLAIGLIGADGRDMSLAGRRPAGRARRADLAQAVQTFTSPA